MTRHPADYVSRRYRQVRIPIGRYARPEAGPSAHGGEHVRRTLVDDCQADSTRATSQSLPASSKHTGPVGTPDSRPRGPSHRGVIAFCSSRKRCRWSYLACRRSRFAMRYSGLPRRNANRSSRRGRDRPSGMAGTSGGLRDKAAPAGAVLRRRPPRLRIAEPRDAWPAFLITGVRLGPLSGQGVSDGALEMARKRDNVPAVVRLGGRSSPTEGAQCVLVTRSRPEAGPWPRGPTDEPSLGVDRELLSGGTARGRTRARQRCRDRPRRGPWPPAVQPASKFDADRTGWVSH